MVDQKLSARIETFIRENGLIHIILPAATPSGFASWKIAPEYITGVFKDRYAAQSVDFTVSIDANTLIEQIDFFFISGSPVVKVGTTLAGKDIISGRTLTTSKNSLNQLGDAKAYFKTAKTLYFTITGVGVVDIILTQKKLYNS